MKASITILALAATVLAVPSLKRASVDPSLIPDPGVTAGVPDPARTGSCLGSNNVAIPCNCPPSKSDIIAKVELFNSQGYAQNTPFSFNTDVSDTSQATQKSRATMLLIALQNFANTDPGVGCPATSAPNYVAISRE